MGQSVFSLSYGNFEVGPGVSGYKTNQTNTKGQPNPEQSQTLNSCFGTNIKSIHISTCLSSLYMRR